MNVCVRVGGGEGAGEMDFVHKVSCLEVHIVPFGSAAVVTKERHGYAQTAGYGNTNLVASVYLGD